MLEPIEQAIELAQAGNKPAARLILLGLVDAEPHNEEAWLWLSYCAKSRSEHSRALREVLRINPDNKHARQLTIKLARRAIQDHSGLDYENLQAVKRFQRRRVLLIIGLVTALVPLLIFGGLLLSGIDLVDEASPTIVPTLSAAQQCQQEITTIVQSLAERCTNVEDGQACLLNAPVIVEGETVGNFAEPGERILLEGVRELVASGYQANQAWGLSILQSEALGGASAKLLLIGEAELRDFDPELSEFNVVTASNAACDVMAKSGLLIQSNDRQINVVANRAQIDLVGTLFIEAVAGEYVRFTPLEGLAQITLFNQAREMNLGQTVQYPANLSGHVAGTVQSLNVPQLSREELDALTTLADAAEFETNWIDIQVQEETNVSVASEATLTDDVILYSARGDLFMVDGVGHVRQLTSGDEDDAYPVLNGALVAFVRDGVLMQLDLSDNSVSTMSDALENPRFPQWTADGLLITTDDGVFLIDDGTSEQILALDATVERAALSEAGVLAYSVARGGITIMADDEPIEIPEASYPAWHGENLAYQSSHEGGTHIYIYDMDDGSTERLTDAVISGESQATWRPDGGAIAFVSRRAGTFDLMSIGDTTQHWVVGDVATPAWGTLSVPVTVPDIAPDGQWVNFPVSVTSNLHDVEFLSSDFGMVVGDNNAVLVYDAGVWARMNIAGAIPGGARLSLYAVDVTTREDAIAVGARGTIIQLNSGVWRAMASPTTETLYDIQGNWAVGANGTILRLINDEWQVVESPTDANLRHIEVEDINAVWVVGDENTYLRWNGREWNPQIVNMAQNWSALDLTGGEWLSGTGGIFRRNGAEFTPIDLTYPSVYNVHDLTIFPDGSGWAMGDNGTLIYGQEGMWRIMPKMTFNDIYAMSFPAEDEGWAVGELGTLLYYTTDTDVDLAENPSTSQVADVADLAGFWDCQILQGTILYPYNLILESLQSDRTIAGSARLPSFGNSLLTLEGIVVTDDEPSGWDALLWEDEVVAWLTLREETLIQDLSAGTYEANGLLRLALLEDGTLRGGTFIGRELVAEIPICSSQ